jgi:hypothetical protein
VLEQLKQPDKKFRRNDHVFVVRSDGKRVKAQITCVMRKNPDEEQRYLVSAHAFSGTRCEREIEFDLEKIAGQIRASDVGGLHGMADSWRERIGFVPGQVSLPAVDEPCGRGCKQVRISARGDA